MYTSFDNITLVKIVTLLKSHKSEYLSGEDISESLKLSRAAVWKHIKKLRSLGYKIDSREKLGYRLLMATDLLLPWEVSEELQTESLGKKIYYFDTIDSTQNFAIELASRSNENGALVISEKQTHGRGRLDRKWESPSGGIWLSVVLHPEFEISHATLFPIAASLALAIAIEKVLKIKPMLKWPNDLTVDDKKVAGILMDLSIESNKIEYMIIGVGINFRIDVHEIRKSIKNTPHYYGVTALVKKDSKTSPAKLVQSFLFELEKLYKSISKENFDYIIREWTKRSSTIGKTITLSSLTGKIRGKAIRIDNDGALVVATHRKSQRVLVGDVV